MNTPTKRAALSLAIAGAALGLTACGHMMRGDGPRATVTIAPTDGNTARGTVHFHQHGDKVMVVGEISGLKPNAEHGFHVHEKNDCSGDGTKTGGHFNPSGVPHGGHSGGARHAGDMPNVKADANGVAKVHAQLDLLKVEESAVGIVNRGVIVHRDPDDYASQPTGNAGARIGCGVIKLAPR